MKHQALVVPVRLPMALVAAAVIMTASAVAHAADASPSFAPDWRLAAAPDERPLDRSSVADGLPTSLDASPPVYAAFAQDGHAQGHERLNRIGLFLGAATIVDGGSTGFSVGLEYERRLSPLIGLGIVGEVTTNVRDVIIAAPVLFVHPFRGLVLSAAPGVSIEDGEGHFLVRFGAGWEFELGEGGFSLAPTISYDIVESKHDVIVYGATLSYAF